MSKVHIITVILFLSIIGLASCSVYKNGASSNISIREISLGMNKETVIAKYGQPFSFNTHISNGDTITVLSYKTPKPVANCEFIVTTELSFVNNELKTISQRDFYVPENVIFNDSTMVR